MPDLTVGMATYDDFNGVYFTLQALRLYHDMQDVELLVVDNYGCESTRSLVEGWAGGRYLLRRDVQGTAAPRDLVFREATGEVVLCCDSHVLFPPGVIARLKQFYREHPECDDLLQGPMLYDDLHAISTHLDPVWRDEFFGTWGTDPRGLDAESAPFEIPMQGLGAFACRKSAWLGFNPRFRGFGGEEGYIHEKFRQAGRRTLCVPWLRWMHRFGRPSGVPYRLTLEDKFRNYLIGHAELGLDLAPVLTHFAARLPDATMVAVAYEALWGSAPGESASAAADTEHAPTGVEMTPLVGSAEPQVEAAPHEDLSGREPLPERRGGATTGAVGRRAIVCFVPDNRHLIQQALALRHSWLHIRSPDTDLVMMGPAGVLARLPDDVVKIEQRCADEDPVWRGYPYANSIACMNGGGAERLDRYTHLLRTDVDTFVTPAWNDFYPTGFVTGHGAYSNDDNVRQRIRVIAARYGLVHRGLTNIGSTWYGPTGVVRQASAFAEMLTKHLVSHEFADDEGAWPGWYRGVALLYAGEIAVNHCAPDAERSALLDAFSTSPEPTSNYVHIHCWHTPERFSKHAFMAGKYTRADARNLDLDVVRDYCMAMSFRSVGSLQPPNRTQPERVGCDRADAADGPRGHGTPLGWRSSRARSISSA
jgi:hypothetical protein